ncbi:energy transducer TonB [Zoogloea sp.]|nr:energy transducer TonB [Zoogloea sp.]MCK6375782.1 TonB family protein [Zoogloea sp.]MCK6394942.1 TonB family protein [Zoogloea sp.]
MSMAPLFLRNLSPVAEGPCGVRPASDIELEPIIKDKTERKGARVTRSSPSFHAEHWHRLAWEHGAPLVLICTAHLAALWWLTTTLNRSPVLTTPPAVVGVLVSAPAATVEPKPLPMAQQPRPTPVPRRRPTPLPPKAPPSERAVAASPPEPAAQPQAATAAVAQAAPPAAAPEAKQPAAPVTPPRADAAMLNNPAPAYPAQSRRLHEEGRVLFDVYILPNGSVGQIKLKRSSGFPRLDDAALEAIRRWRYVPAKRGDEPIPYWYVQPLDFQLDS